MIKKTDILKDILQKNAKAEEILLGFGMHCLYWWDCWLLPVQ